MKKENYISLTLTTLNKHQKFTSNIFYFSFTNIYIFLIFQILAQRGFTNCTTKGNYFFLHGSSEFAQLKWWKKKIFGN